MRVLFVCLGNICRSPAAEAMARHRGVTCDSAGTSAWHLNEPPYGPMLTALAARGIAASDLRARQIGADDFRAFDLILAADRSVLADCAALDPGNGAKLELICPDGSEVPDPYYTRDFDGCLALLDTALSARGW